jgi:hypothetical protein
MVRGLVATDPVVNLSFYTCRSTPAGFPPAGRLEPIVTSATPVRTKPQPQVLQHHSAETAFQVRTDPATLDFF